MLPSLVQMSKAATATAAPADDATASRNRTQARIGLASNAVGLAAAGAGTVAATRDLKAAKRKAAGLPEIEEGAKEAGVIATKLKGIKGRHAVGLAGAALGLQLANAGGDVVANRVLARSAKAPAPSDPDDPSVQKSHRGDSAADAYISESRGDGRGRNLTVVDKAMVRTPQMMLGTELPDEEVLKRARRYDPEADRQRRMGLYAGLGGGVSMVAGSKAADRLSGQVNREKRTVTVPRMNLKGLEGNKLKAAKKVRGGVGLAALSAASGAGGLAAYRHGISRRNQPYN